MFLARAGMGISEAFYLPTALALICDYHREGTRSLAIGIHQCGIYVGTALGGIGGYLAEYFGWRAGFGVLGAVGAGYALVLMKFLPGAPPNQALPGSGTASQPTSARVRLVPALASLAGQWGYWILLTGFLLLGITTWLIYGWLPTYLREHFHLWIGAAGLSATGYVQAASVVGVLAGGRWADRWAGTNRRGRMYVAALGCMIAAPGLFLMADTDSFPVGIGALLLLGLGIGFYTTNTMPILRQVTDARYSATGYGIYNFAGCIAGGLMAYAGGAFRDHHGDLALIFRATAAGVLAAGLLLLAAKPLTGKTNPCAAGPAPQE
jgi:predicted MFS family arabinose efflux permease